MHRTPHDSHHVALPHAASRLVLLASAEDPTALDALTEQGCRELLRSAGFDPDVLPVDAPAGVGIVRHPASRAHRDVDGLEHAAGPAYASLAVPLHPAQQGFEAEREAADAKDPGHRKRAAENAVEDGPCSPGALGALVGRAAATMPGVEVCAIPASLLGEGPRMLIMDVDSTLIRQEVIDQLAAHAGRAAEVAAVTGRAMRGELDFAASLRERVAALAGLPAAVLDEVREGLTLTAGTRDLIHGFRDRGDAVCAVSGGFSQILDPLAQELGLARARANRLEIQDGLLTGRVEGPIVDAEAKEASLRAWAREHGVSPARTVAVGDGANDLRMVGAAGLGVALAAKPALRDAADVRVPWPRLDAVLTLLGD